MSDEVAILSNRPAKVKKVYPIVLSIDQKTPFKARSAPEFKDYFNKLWKEIDENE